MASFLIVAEDVPSSGFYASWLLAARADRDFGSKEIMPRYARLHVPEIQVQTALEKIGPWVRVVGFHNTIYDDPSDSYTIDMEADNASADHGRITTEDAAEPVALLGGSVIADTITGVTINIPVPGLVARWVRGDKMQIPLDRFTHVSEQQGLHTFDLLYDGLIGDTPIATHVLSRGADILQQDVDTGQLRFEMHRDAAIADAQEFLSRELGTNILEATWKLTSTAFSSLISAGGEIEISEQQLTNNLVDMRI